MDTLKIPPDSGNYTVDEPNTNVAVMLDGGDPRVRQDQLGAPKTVNATFTLDQAGFDYMMAFYRTSTGFGSLPFLASLCGIDSSAFVTYTCRIVPGSWKPVTQQQGLAYWLKCQLWVTPTNDTTNDAATIAAYNLSL